MALSSQYLAIVRCIFKYVGYYVKCSFKPRKKVQRQELCYTLHHLTLGTPEHEMIHEPITKKDAAAGISYLIALLKALRLHDESINDEYYVVIGKQAEKSKTIATVRGQPIFYVLNHALKMSGCKLSSVGNVLGMKDLFICSISQI